MKPQTRRHTLCKTVQFSSYIVSTGYKVLEVSTDEKFLDINLDKAEQNSDKFFLRSHSNGKPENISYELGGTTYIAVKVGDKIYIPDREKTT